MKKLLRNFLVLTAFISIFTFLSVGTKASTSSYKNTIDSFKVTTNSKYQPHAGKTFCNIFAQDVMKKLGTPLPDGPCSTILSKLKGNATTHWRSVSAVTAQNRANNGDSTIGITSDHIVVIYPHGNTAKTVGDLWMSMSGYKCFNNTSIRYAWTSSALSNVKFYSWY
ncbi:MULTISPECIES: hypothetical protein [Clostridium]|uniref:Uncharacterized protein n=1 Tax=Clostridium cibarium TaxID=2762247 RepID=A0ABR8PTG8_9CLOT|nr:MULTISPECIES: hypothetical protein [Clostridium]MBD7911459.1 hypothetical protein [Clostridium cibarium]